ncbi:MAG: CCA tRNA nucleotidyltransferase [Lysinibacillus sp.]
MKKQWQAASRVIEKIEQAGFEAVFVGGAVRDILLNRPFHDVDVATSALPIEVKRIFCKTVDVGIEHGTILVLDEGEPIEVTTYRTEGDYVDYRRPEVVQFVRQLERDLQRRDFTMNALAMKRSGEIVDLYGGQEDLTKQIIRAVGVPDERFTEDALRMLRAVRFCAQLNFSIENETFQAMERHAHLLEHIAVERIAQELEKMWTSADPMRGLQILVNSGLANYLPGSYEQILPVWKHFKAEDARDGWAYFIITTNDSSLITRYKLSNKEKNYILAVKEAFLLLQHEVQNVALFYTDSLHLQVAARFAKWLNVDIQNIEELLKRKAAFPLAELAELQVTGHDLMSWKGERGGPWVKEAIDTILQAVLNNEVKNDKNQIKDWFLRQ